MSPARRGRARGDGGGHGPRSRLVSRGQAGGRGAIRLAVGLLGRRRLQRPPASGTGPVGSAGKYDLEIRIGGEGPRWVTGGASPLLVRRSARQGLCQSPGESPGALALAAPGPAPASKDRRRARPPPPSAVAAVVATPPRKVLACSNPAPGVSRELPGRPLKKSAHPLEKLPERRPAREIPSILCTDLATSVERLRGRSQVRRAPAVPATTENSPR